MRSIRRAVGEALMFATEPRHAVQNPKCGAANVVARGPCMLYIPRWPWHAAAELGATLHAPPQYWRSQPRGLKALFGDTPQGGR